MYGRPPPIESQRKHFAIHLEFCIVNGVGLDSSSGDFKWSSALLAKRSGYPGFSEKAVETWRSGIALPGSENWRTLRVLLTGREQFASEWRSVLEGALRDDATMSRRERTNGVRQQKQAIRDRAANLSFPALIREVAENDKIMRETAQHQLLERGALLRSSLREIVPEAAESIGRCSPSAPVAQI